MIIIKQPRHDRFAITPKELLENPNLSWKAKGMLTWITSHSDGYKLCLNALIKNFSKDGRDSIYAGIKELIKFGYMAKHQPNLNGRFGSTHYMASQEPQTGAFWAKQIAEQNWYEVEGVGELSTGEDTANGFSVSGNSASGKSDTKNNNTKNNKIIKNKNIPELFKQVYSAYPKHVDKQDAEQAFETMAKKLTPEELLARVDLIIIDVSTRRATGDWKDRELKHIKSLARYIRGKKWEDKPELAAPQRKSTMDLLMDRDWAKELMGQPHDEIPEIPQLPALNH